MERAQDFRVNPSVWLGCVLRERRVPVYKGHRADVGITCTSCTLSIHKFNLGRALGENFMMI